jgi:hypothetical protein
MPPPPLSKERAGGVREREPCQFILWIKLKESKFMRKERAKEEEGGRAGGKESKVGKVLRPPNFATRNTSGGTRNFAAAISNYKLCRLKNNLTAETKTPIFFKNKKTCFFRQKVAIIKFREKGCAPSKTSVDGGKKCCSSITRRLTDFHI